MHTGMHTGMHVPVWFVHMLKAYPSRYVRLRTPTGAVGLGYRIAMVVYSYDQLWTVSSQELLAVTVKLVTCTHIHTMPRQLSLHAKQRARKLMAQGTSVKKTMEYLHKEGIFPCHQTISRFKRHYNQHVHNSLMCMHTYTLTGTLTRIQADTASTKHVPKYANGNPRPEQYLDALVSSQARTSQCSHRQTESVGPLVVTILSPCTI